MLIYLKKRLKKAAKFGSLFVIKRKNYLIYFLRIFRKFATESFVQIII